MDLVLQKGIDDAAWKHLAGWSDAVSPAEGRGMEWAALRWHALAVEAGEPVAHASFDRFTVKAGGMDTSVVGVSGVVVLSVPNTPFCVVISAGTWPSALKADHVQPQRRAAGAMSVASAWPRPKMRHVATTRAAAQAARRS